MDDAKTMYVRARCLGCNGGYVCGGGGDVPWEPCIVRSAQGRRDCVVMVGE